MNDVIITVNKHIAFIFIGESTQRRVCTSNLKVTAEASFVNAVLCRDGRAQQ